MSFVTLTGISAEMLPSIFHSYRGCDDFIGLDMTHKLDRMGNNRPRPIANTRVESKYGKIENVVEKGTGKGVSAPRETRKRPTGCLRSTGWDVTRGASYIAKGVESPFDGQRSRV